MLAAVALHPNEAGAGKATDDALAEIDRLAALPRVRAVGETGLDRYRTGPEGWAAQEASFRAHIRIAKEHGVALVIHDRDAHEEILAVLDDEGAPEHTVFHCFSGDAAFAQALRRARVRAVLRRHADLRQRRLPARGGGADPGRPAARRDRRPVPHRRCRTAAGPTPRAWCPHTVRALAEVTGVDLAELCADLTATAERVFGIWEDMS